MEIVREIDDPATGDRWLLERTEQNPGGPGRMVLVSREEKARALAQGLMGQELNQKGKNDSNFAEALPPPIIHAGDRLIVEEHTKRLDVALEAIALAPAREGGTVRVRLSIGGRVVKTVAVAPGRASLSPDPGEQP
ncbi:MAG TPA: flagella basal body P-ring formation protein FlgA [Terracidiphilus sp.]|nr:flagella basal body P-ring formation protein FlgA [Terracidiphilus sp.]